ncbi:S8 family serine peptidase [Aestuariicoccus sp. KMU-90]|uniref:S8 family serine peptidase n=2 Tax=Thetidibacter halocola TaxID=2827239 RepID=A0A8J7WC75_9RHOB|nr:S8 family serine peptidase [Thetidibacter halocola]
MLSKAALRALLFAIVVILALPFGDPVLGPSAAWADDHDGDDGDDDDDDDDDDGRGSVGFGGGEARAERERDRPRASVVRRQSIDTPAPRRAAPAPAPVIRAIAAPEILATGVGPEDLAQLLTEGFVLLEERSLPRIGLAVSRLAPPSGSTLEAARDRVRALPSAPVADLNHFYRSSQAVEIALPACTDLNCDARLLAGWPAQGCGAPVRIGVIDTGVNADHEILSGAALEVLSLTDGAGDPSQAIHGTAIVSLLVGGPDSRVPGLLPRAEVVAVDIFARERGDERASALSLLLGLDLLAGRDLRVVNLSLSGPENSLLSDLMTRLAAERGMVFVAAAGNGGPDAPPAWPAAHPDAIAVTAVDTRGRVWRGAQRGDHLDLAAPGVDLLLATSIRGARPQTGTSFAVPFVTAAAALLARLEGMQTPQAVAEALRAAARDAGAEGADPVFGAGIVDATGFCTE